MNHLTLFLSKHQHIGDVQSISQIAEYLNCGEDEVYKHLRVLQEQGELKYTLLDAIPPEKYVFLTEVINSVQWSLLMPIVDDENVGAEWLQQLYPVLTMNNNLHTIIKSTPTARERYQTLMPVYKQEFFDGPLGQRILKDAEELGFNIGDRIAKGLNPGATTTQQSKPIKPVFVVYDSDPQPGFLGCMDVDTLTKPSNKI